MTDCKDMDALIIAGQPKAGSTSVYDWLSCHPAFRPSRIKEARFFLDADYPIPSGVRFDGTNLDRYPDLFNKTDGDILLDASPDYMYCQNFAEVARLLPKAKLVLLQRDPVERLVSWYRYAAQRGFLGHGATFEQFMDAQVSPLDHPDAPVWQRALDQNRFDHYAAPLLQAFGARAITLQFNDLRSDPKTAMDRICRLVDVPADMFDDFSFAASNVTSGAASGALLRHYDRLRAKAMYALPLSPKQMARLRPISRAVRKVLTGKQPSPGRPEIDAATRDTIAQIASQ